MRAIATGISAVPFRVAIFSARRIADSIVYTLIIMSESAPITSCWSASVIMLLLDGGAGCEERQLLGGGEQIVLGG